MAKIISQKTSLRLPPQGRSEKNEEWGRQLSGIIICPNCKNIRYLKKWYHAQKLPNLKNSKQNKKICPACTMIKHNLFEGELLIEKVPIGMASELLNLIRSYGKKATDRDPQDRIIKVQKISGGYRVTTTENQLAVRLGKKTKDVFKTVELKITHAKEPAEVSRAYATFTK